MLRNLLLGVSRDPRKWADLQDIVADLFGYELTCQVPARTRFWQDTVKGQTP